MEGIWKVYYWTAFVLCWGFLPFLSEFVRNGEFTVRARAKSTIIRNMRYYALIGSVFGLFLIYLWAKDAFAK